MSNVSMETDEEREERLRTKQQLGAGCHDEYRTTLAEDKGRAIAEQLAVLKERKLAWQTTSLCKEELAPPHLCNSCIQICMADCTAAHDDIHFAEEFNPEIAAPFRDAIVCCGEYVQLSIPM